MTQPRSLNLSRGATGRLVRDRLMTGVFTSAGWVAMLFIARMCSSVTR